MEQNEKKDRGKERNTQNRIKIVDIIKKGRQVGRKERWVVDRQESMTQVDTSRRINARLNGEGKAGTSMYIVT
jgi:hypothetical protein